MKQALALCYAQKMAGSLVSIVDPATILNNDQISNEEITFSQPIQATADAFGMLEWAARRKLIMIIAICTTYNAAASLNRYSQGTDGYRWQCNAHNFSVSVRSKSFFSRSKLPLRKLLKFVYMWCADFPQDEIMFELGMGVDCRSTVIDWANFMRDVCQEFLNRNPQEIGVFCDNGQQLTVEIDESLFFHQKYQRGKPRGGGHWVFGGVARECGRCFMLKVPDCSRATLEPIIQQFILPRSHNMSDGWQA